MFGPADQRPTERLKGGEPVGFDGFHPEGPFAFRLPQVVPMAQTKLGQQRIDSRFSLARIDLDPGARGLSMLWLATVPCGGQDEQLDFTIVRIRQMAGVMA